jgi:arylformamidase
MYEEVYDISILLWSESTPFPGDTPYVRNMVLTLEDSGICNTSRLTMSTHSGTHIDAPSHYVKNAKSIDQYSIQSFILPVQVVNIKNKELIDSSELQGLDIQTGGALLFRTNNSISGLSSKGGAFSDKYVYLSAEGADFCVEKKLNLVGIDYISIERFGDNISPAHHKLLGNGILILEGINLREVPPGEYTMFCFPLRIKDGEASPVRAVLVR